MSGLFEPGFPGLMKFLYMHDQLLEQMLPRLYYHFVRAPPPRARACAGRVLTLRRH